MTPLRLKKVPLITRREERGGNFQRGKNGKRTSKGAENLGRLIPSRKVDSNIEDFCGANRGGEGE